MDGDKREPPRIAAKYWDEFSGKQRLLSTFFGKKSEVPPVPSLRSLASVPIIPVAASSHKSPSTDLPSVDTHEASSQFVPSTQHEPRGSTPSPAPESSREAISRPTKPRESSHSAPKRKKMQADSNYPAQATKKQKTQKSGQTKLSSFFGNPVDTSPPPISTSNALRHLNMEDVDSPKDEQPIVSTNTSDTPDVDEPSLSQIQADYDLAQQLSSSQEVTASSASSTGDRKAWSQLFAPIQPPKCTIHAEPAKEFKVNKPGPNKGKTFFICSR